MSLARTPNQPSPDRLWTTGLVQLPAWRPSLQTTSQVPPNENLRASVHDKTDPSSTRKSKRDNVAGAIFAKTTPTNLATNYIRTAPRCTGNMLTFAPLTTVYDSMYVLDSLTKNLKRMGRQRAPQKRNSKRKRDLKDVTGEVKINTAIWKNIQKNPIRLRIQHLFFKSIHKTHKIGRY